MLIKVKVKWFNAGLEPAYSEAYVNPNLIGYVGPLDWDEIHVRVPDAPMECEVLVDGQEKTLLFKDREDYDAFIEQVQRSLCAFIPRL